MGSRRGSALLEFALVWPLLLLVVLGSVQFAVWFADQHAVHAAALAGARAGARAGQGPRAAQDAALAVLRTSLAGPAAEAWCPGGAAPAPPVWVCGRSGVGTVEVLIGGAAPPLVPLLPGALLTLAADATMAPEAFT